ncbi:hypothetical protein HAQ01_06820 [Acidithiobacillus thiooxidans]|uniref:AHH domain-containing protein n=1 Tax=Acidithiobacillus thiooxidans TaxID=930 RepID=UPI001C0664C4|nr:hypothetical protein [Acidithiobacillus thiooxidans]
MTAAGDPRPGSGCAAHHIVPSNEGRYFAKDIVKETAGILSKCGIKINDAINGVWLPQNKDSACYGAYHPSLHNSRYYQYLKNSIMEAYINADSREEGCANVRRALATIKTLLSNGSTPWDIK